MMHKLHLLLKREYAVFLVRVLKTFIVYKPRLKGLGKWSQIVSPITITPKHIAIGDRVSIGHHARIEAIEHWQGKNYEPLITMEDGVSFQQRCHITAADSIYIGKNTIASFDVMITDIDHEYEDITLPIGQQGLVVRKTSIGESCFIGAGTKIQAGTILGKHCIVGANSVVRGHFPDYCVLVGAPARVIKQYNFETKQWEKVDA
ncbi:acyltransferase [Vibrio sinaloensis]|uniref:acyltransferase n=1 Tax=Photobacterium sp. (strain ATCC 43367) TaxID=379097 RepID=UPI0035EBA140